MDRWSRRQFVRSAGVAGVGLLAGCGRLPWQAEQPARVPHIGVLSLITADPSDVDNAAFRQGLRDLGYSEGQNITLEWRASSSGVNQYPELAADLVGLSVDVIVAQGLTATRAAKQASVTTPVVMAYSPDPVRNGFVASQARHVRARTSQAGDEPVPDRVRAVGHGDRGGDGYLVRRPRGCEELVQHGVGKT